jgi:WhiB family transcriptional regulator, redox-sensing transcriptional regulator
MRDWLSEALCAHLPVEWWTDPPDPQAVKDARKVCAQCPVMVECYELAAVEEPDFGVWAGLTADERGAA